MFWSGQDRVIVGVLRPIPGAQKCLFNIMGQSPGHGRADLCCVTAGKGHKPLGLPLPHLQSGRSCPALPCPLGSFRVCEHCLRPGKDQVKGRAGEPLLSAWLPLFLLCCLLPLCKLAPGGATPQGVPCCEAVRVSGGCPSPFCLLLDISLEYSGSCQQGAVAPHTLTPALCFLATPKATSVSPGVGVQCAVAGRWRPF